MPGDKHRRIATAAGKVSSHDDFTVALRFAFSCCLNPRDGNQRVIEPVRELAQNARLPKRRTLAVIDPSLLNVRCGYQAGHNYPIQLQVGRVERRDMIRPPTLRLERLVKPALEGGRVSDCEKSVVLSLEYRGDTFEDHL